MHIFSWLSNYKAGTFHVVFALNSQLPANQQDQSKIPQNLAEIDKGKILGFGAALASDHPGYGDNQYKLRRVKVAKMALDHQEGSPVPRLEYLPEETQCWGRVLQRLKELYPSHACQEFLQNLPRYNFEQSRVPQLEDVSQILQSSTGWKIHPVAGLLHPRQFLNACAFKTFYSTQYMRHSSQPMYTPEPDVCHELLGHAVMLADPHYADLVQTIGVASLHADEKQIWHLTKVYWYTVEFGVVHEGNEVKAFGAGLLSSYGELEHMRSGKAEFWAFDPFQELPKMSYKEGFQKGYFVLDSFQTGAQQLHDYCQAISNISDRKVASSKS